MLERQVILRNPDLPESQDFDFLRRTGIGFIEKLASEIWTDYNTHDPGITLLEMLCYGITDLGYRTGHDFKNILTRETRGVPALVGDFHRARDILTSGPITFLDLRKFVIDIRGVRHAWVLKHTAAKYLLDKEKALIIPCSEKLKNNLLDHEEEVVLNGLYDLHIEYDENIDDLRVGLRDNTRRKGGYVVPEIGQMQFRVERDILLKKVSVYAEEPGDVVVSLLDSDGKVVQGPILKKVTKANVKTDVPLNFPIYAPQDLSQAYYTLSAEGSNVNLYTTSRGNYPFELDGFIRITTGLQKGEPDKNYFYFYDWHIDVPLANPDGSSDSYLTTERVGLAERKINDPEGGYNAPEDKGILFNVHGDITLEGVYIYGSEPGEVTVNVLNDHGEPERNITVEIHSADQKTWVPIDLELSECQNFKIEAESKNVELYASHDVAFPFMLKDAITLMAGYDPDGYSDTYYFFFDWQISYQKKINTELPQLPNTKMYVRNKVRDRILSCRNLCEDLIDVKELETEDVGVCADIILDPGAKPEEVLANIYYLMEEHVKPSVTFYTIDELQADPKNKTMDEIFSGPPLEHGFIDDDELREIKLKKEIRISDVIQLISDIEGVRQVKELSILSFIGEDLESEEEWVWCPIDDPCFVANFSTARSNVLFYKNNVPVAADPALTRRFLRELTIQELKRRNKKQQKDLADPLGVDMELDDYLPVQNELPLNYYVGRYSVPDSASITRKAQARQLKGFLLFFEQLLTNYLAQLEHIPDLFSWNYTAETPAEEEAETPIYTYYTQVLDKMEIADFENLYIKYPEIEVLRELIEDPETAEQRKNELLEHLIARFSESFVDYGVMLFRQMGDTSDSRRRLIDDKKAFLDDYPKVSGHRAKGYDYRYPLEEDNLSGLQRRVYRLLGFKDVKRPPFGCAQIQVVYTEKDLWHFIVVDENGNVLLKSDGCQTKAAAEGVLEVVLSHFPSRNDIRFEVEECDGVWTLVRYCGKEEEGIEIATFTDDCDVDEAIAILERCANVEGFHVVEHILLRSRIESEYDTKGLPVNIPGEDVDCTGPESILVRDPYSFRVSIVLPAWSRRFSDITYRQYVEEVIRRETPAHIYVRICWVGHEALKEFEACLCEWEIQLSELSPSYSGSCPMPDRIEPIYQDYHDARLKLIDKLTKLEQRYPYARLHDCDTVTESTSPQIILGQSNLAPSE